MQKYCDITILIGEFGKIIGNRMDGLTIDEFDPDEYDAADLIHQFRVYLNITNGAFEIKDQSTNTIIKTFKTIKPFVKYFNSIINLIVGSNIVNQ